MKNFKLKRLTKAYDKTCTELINCVNTFFNDELRLVIPAEAKIPVANELLLKIKEQLPLMEQMYATAKTLPRTDENRLNETRYRLAVETCNDWIDYLEDPTNHYGAYRNLMTIKDFMMSNGICLGQIKLHIDTLNEIKAKMKATDSKFDINSIFYNKETIDAKYRKFSDVAFATSLEFVKRDVDRNEHKHLTDDFKVVIDDGLILSIKFPDEVNALYRKAAKLRLPLEYNEPTPAIIDFIYNAVRGETTEFPYPERYQKEPVFRKCLFEGMTQEDLDYLNRHRANDPMFK